MNFSWLASVSVVSLLSASGTVAAQSEAMPAGFPVIDAHVHIAQPTAALYEFIERMGIRMVNVAYIDKSDPFFNDAAKEHEAYRSVFRLSRGRMPWCATFDAQDWEQPGFASRTIADLDKAFEQGALAVKIWKTIGMWYKSRTGEFVLPDNPVFRPVLDHIATRGKTLYAHLAEPASTWLPLEKMKPLHAKYYSAHPEWHMYQHPGGPSKETILAARDRMVSQHPNLRIIGCHLGSMEEHVADVAKRLDRYPNFAVDTAERIPDLMGQPREEVRAFLLRYQDRVIYATDFTWTSTTDEREMLKRMQDVYTRDWKYLATQETLELDGKKVQGLELPVPVLHKIYHDNAIRWVPELKSR